MMKNEALKKRRFNFIDIAIILLVVAIVVGGIYAISRMGGLKNAGINATVTYKLEATNVQEEISAAAVVGDKVNDKVTKTDLGVIKAVEREPMTMQTTDFLTGVMKTVDVPGRYKVTLTIESPAVNSGGKVTINSHRMAVGTSFEFRSKHFSAAGTCVSSIVSDAKKGAVTNG